MKFSNSRVKIISRLFLCSLYDLVKSTEVLDWLYKMSCSCTRSNQQPSDHFRRHCSDVITSCMFAVEDSLNYVMPTNVHFLLTITLSLTSSASHMHFLHSLWDKWKDYLSNPLYTVSSEYLFLFLLFHSPLPGLSVSLPLSTSLLLIPTTSWVLTNTDPIIKRKQMIRQPCLETNTFFLLKGLS